MTQNSRKMTTKELTQAVGNLGQAMNHMSTLVANDIQQIMGVLAGLLDHQGLLEHFKCPSCGEELSHPNLDGVQRPTACPKCGSDISEEDLANMTEEE
jgi:predicted Zn-ribbon and HTH transcriptional regulator